MVGLCWFALSLAFLIALGLLLRAWPVMAGASPAKLLFSSAWHPTRGEFGLAAFIIGTFWVTAIAIILAVPLSILTAVYLAEFAPKKVAALIRPVIDLLAGISPVIFGVFGLLVIVPLTGYCALAAGIVLAIMVFPIIISVVEEVLRTVPAEIREAALSLGATRWEAVKLAVLRRARPGIIAAVILGLSRAFGETMAVLMVAGCSLQSFPKSFFDPAYPLPALIANTYGEMMSIPLYDAAVLFAAFILLLVTIGFNMVGWGILLRSARSDA